MCAYTYRGVLRIAVPQREREWTALHLGAASCSLALVRYQIDLGAVVDPCTHGDSNPIHLAAAGGHARVVELLLKLGSNMLSLMNSPASPTPPRDLQANLGSWSTPSVSTYRSV